MKLLSVRCFVWRDNYVNKPINNYITNEIEIIDNMIYKNTFLCVILSIIVFLMKLNFKD